MREFTTETGCTIRVIPWHVTGRQQSSLTLTMEQPGDGRRAEVQLTDEERLNLARAALAPNEIIVGTRCDTPDDVRAHLLAANTRKPSLHPDIDNPDPWKTWNGWNYTKTFGRDAAGAGVTVEMWHFANPDTPNDINVRVDGGTGEAQGLLHPFQALDLITYPVVLVPAFSVIRHPEHTPRDDLP
jgi:hypothetical protein